MPQLSNRGIWKITYPVLISLMMQHLIGVVDSLFLGRIGEIELGAAGLGGVYYLSFFMLAFGFSTGAQIIIGRRNGEGRHGEIGPVFMQGVMFLVGLAVISFVALRYFSPVLLRGIIESDLVYEATLEYVDWRIYGYFFSFVILAYRAFYVGTTRTGILTWNAVVMLSVNTLLNYLLIFGKGGLPQLGIAGAAIASSLSELVSLLFLTGYTAIAVKWRQYRLFFVGKIDWKLLFEVLRLSIWTMLQSFVSLSIWFVFFIAVEHLGSRELAISNVVRNVSAMIYMFAASFSTTANSLVSNIIGAGGERHVMSLTRRLVRMCFVIQLPVVVFCMAFPALVLGCFTEDCALIEAAVPSMVVMASSYFLHVPAYIYLSAVMGTGNTLAAMVIDFLTLPVYLAAVVLMAWYYRADIAVCWTTEHIYSIVMLVLSYGYMKKGYWKGKVV